MTKAEIKAKFDDIVAFAEIDKFLDTPVKRYSSGMYVRLAFAVAAHLDPEILIVDEVLAVGDIQFQKKCTGKMSEVAAHGRTVLFVSHNMAAIRSLCSRAVLLTDGSISMDGTPHEVADAYVQSGSKAAGSVEWSDLTTAPGDNCVRLKSLSVSGGNMQDGLVDIQKGFQINVEYQVLSHRQGINVGLILSNGGGEAVVSASNLRSCSASYDPWVDRSYAPGLYRSSCIFPGCLLNDGLYS
jgi:lipopolysaccharide transport system ATP-binding protein